MEFNFLAILVAAIVPIILGFFWYNPKTFGILWAREAEMTEEKMKRGNVPVTFIVSLMLSFILAFFVQMLTIHQFGAIGMVGGDPSIAEPSYEAFMADYGNAFRTYKHGALHGAMAGIFMFVPVIAINALFERKSWKYILINGLFWTVAITIMGAIVCGWV
ncbi:DUF1761 domain-containing protein [Psychroserpens mesophilus]|uniref:DUF1761 domain-containing protein n=1 Tax=Psychroserpens mesophilus TaxID=325473 RepID=UPI003D6505C3